MIRFFVKLTCLLLIILEMSNCSDVLQINQLCKLHSDSWSTTQTKPHNQYTIRHLVSTVRNSWLIKWEPFKQNDTDIFQLLHLLIIVPMRLGVFIVLKLVFSLRKLRSRKWSNCLESPQTLEGQLKLIWKFNDGFWKDFEGKDMLAIFYLCRIAYK